ncbi:Gag-pol fusion protein [Phytophthora cinnamomi]|uniref:Gag-pol fusion protein n=1 Tax=Phytophthora cinnamomi TaxID=4785 RepID=UPI003559B1AB|nr:Gag-pol fusion protein [Phytophthora cinnamomi]
MVATNGDTACEKDASTVPATVVDDEGEKMDDMQVKSNDGSVAAIRRAVAAHLNEELAVRDGERAERYISTVRPAMATLRYVHKVDEDDDDQGGDDTPGCKTTETTAVTTSAATTTKIALVHVNGVALSEEGDTAVGAMATKDDVTTMESSTLELGMELNDEVVTKLGSVAMVRMTIKRSKRETKRQRARKTVDGDPHVEDDVARVVAGLEVEQVRRRRQQADDARGELEERRRQRAAKDDVRKDERVRVNLVQRGSTMTDETTDSNDGTEWMARGERRRVNAPVAYVEGIGGFLLDVLGVWTFNMVNVYGQKVVLDACIIDGCTNEFLVGVDFLEKHRATMDFDRGEVRYDERGREIIIPFRMADNDDDSAATAVRLVRATNLHRRTVQPVEVTIAAPDGEEAPTSVHVPTGETTAATVTTDSTTKTVTTDGATTVLSATATAIEGATAVTGAMTDSMLSEATRAVIDVRTTRNDDTALDDATSSATAAQRLDVTTSVSRKQGGTTNTVPATMNIADIVNDAVHEDDDVDMMDAAARKTNDAVPTSHLTKYHDDVSLATPNDETASAGDDEPDTPTMNDAVARGTNESPAATDALATSGGSAMAVTMLPETTVTNAPATRRSARIREQAQRHVHWATTVPNTDDVNDTNDVNEANDVNDTAPITEPPTATTTTTRTVSTDALEGVREAITTVDPRAMITTMVGTETRTTLGTVPLTRAPTPCDDGAPAKRADVARDDERRAVTTSARRSDAAKPTTKGTAKKSTTNATTVKTKKVPTTASVVNDAVAVTNDVDGMDGNDDTAPVDDYTLQLSDDEIATAQQRSKFVKRLLAAGKYGSMKAESNYHYPEPLLAQVALDIDEQLEYEDKQPARDESATTAPVLAATVTAERTASAGRTKRPRAAVDDTAGHDITRGLVVERRRRRRRNGAGQYVLEYELCPYSDPIRWTTNDKELWLEEGRARTRWTSVAEYERLYRDDRVVEDPGDEEVV